jgi:Fic family protein
MLQGVAETAAWTTERIGAIRRLSQETAQLVQAELPKIYTRELIDVVFEQPYCRIANVVDAGVAQRQAASRYLKAMAAIGVLEERTVGREKLFVNTKLLELLTAET